MVHYQYPQQQVVTKKNLRRVCGDKLNSKKSQYIHFCLLSTDYVCKHKQAYYAQKLGYMSAFFPLSWSANKYDTMGSNLNEEKIKNFV